MSLKQLGNYKMESKSTSSKREVRTRRLLKKLRKNGSVNKPHYMYKHYKDYEY